MVVGPLNSGLGGSLGGKEVEKAGKQFRPGPHRRSQKGLQSYYRKRKKRSDEKVQHLRGKEKGGSSPMMILTPP